MRTERQKQAARANGARSRGPVTPEGKLASARNAMTHGMLSGTVVLTGESEERFNALLADLHAELQPQTTVECTLVENMAVARWRQMRIWGIEKANMEHQMRAGAEARGATEDGAPDDAPDDDPATRCALAFRTLSDDSHSLELINRYESRYDRQYLRAHRRFLDLVDRRSPPPPPALKNAGPSVQASQPVGGLNNSTPGPAPVPPAAENAPQSGNTVSAKRTRQALKLMLPHRLAAVACAIIFSAIPFIRSATDASGQIAGPAQARAATLPAPALKYRTVPQNALRYRPREPLCTTAGALAYLCE